MTSTFVIYTDHRGWPLLEGKCAASVMGQSRLKQCSRKATTEGTVKSYNEATAGVNVFYVPMCSQHSKADNVVTTPPAMTINA